MFQLKDSTSLEFSDKNWQDFFELLRALKDKYDSPLSTESWQSFKKKNLSFMEMDKSYSETVFYDNEIAVAWAGVYVNCKGTDNELLCLYFDFNYDKVPDELNKLAVSFFINILKKFNHTRAFFMSPDQRTSYAARSWHAEEHGIMNEYNLYKEKANRELIKEWLETIPDKNKDLTLKPYRELPEKYLTPYAELFAISINEMPESRDSDFTYQTDADELLKQEEWRRKNNIVKYHYIIVNEKDELIGLSTARVNPKKTDVINQYMTGVASVYRGRSLAKWLKGSVFMAIEKEFPDYKMINTQMRAVNEPIQKINEQMGYIKTKEGNEFWVSLENFEKFLAK